MQYIKSPPRTGKIRGTIKNIKNFNIKRKNAKTQINKQRRRSTLFLKRLNKMANIAYVVFGIASKHKAESVDSTDLGFSTYSNSDFEEIAKKCMRLTDNPTKMLKIFHEEWALLQSEEEKYRLANTLSMEEITLKAFSKGNAATNKEGRNASYTSISPHIKNSLTSFFCIFLICLGRADAAWYDVSVPYTERNIFNNIQTVSSSISTVCLAMSVIPSPTTPITATCALAASSISSACAVGDMSVRFIDHFIGRYPLTKGQIAMTGLSAMASAATTGLAAGLINPEAAKATFDASPTVIKGLSAIKNIGENAAKVAGGVSALSTYALTEKNPLNEWAKGNPYIPGQDFQEEVTKNLQARWNKVKNTAKNIHNRKLSSENAKNAWTDALPTVLHGPQLNKRYENLNPLQQGLMKPL